jgi:hypothetical protein
VSYADLFTVLAIDYTVQQISTFFDNIYEIMCVFLLLKGHTVHRSDGVDIVTHGIYPSMFSMQGIRTCRPFYAKFGTILF